MYQGKFDAKSKGQQAPDQTLDEILKERDEANAALAAKRAQREAQRAANRSAAGRPAQPAGMQRPTGQRPAQRPAQSGAQRPAQSGSPRPAGNPAQQRPAASGQRPAPNQRPAQPPRKQTQNEVVLKKRGPRTGGIIFYSFYFGLIFIFFVGVFIGLNWLNGWLKDYEAAQPTVKGQQVFEQLFANPDWAQLYRLAGDPTGTGTNKYDTQFEGSDAYVRYMQEKVGTQQLEYVETSGGLTGKKYLVRLGTEKLASFTLLGQQDSITDIPDWQLGEVELFITRNQSIKIRKLESHVAYVNNNPLSDDYTIQIASTKADENLAAENRVRTSIQEVDGLMTTPELLVYDQTGAPIEVRYNSDSGMFEEQIAAIAITDEERNAVFGALEAYAGFMINASGSRAAVSKYFEGGTQTYNDIVQMNSELWMNADRGHEFRNEEILGYTKHSDTMFSVRASMVMHVTNKDNTEKDYNVVQSMYFNYKGDKWMCSEMTNEDITAPVGEVRLTFFDAAGNQLSSAFYATDAQSLTAPVLEVPAGKTFSGWATVETSDDGQKTWTIVFQPDEVGNITLSSGYTLTPMKLYPVFQDAQEVSVND